MLPTYPHFAISFRIITLHTPVLLYLSEMLPTYPCLAAQTNHLQTDPNCLFQLRKNYWKDICTNPPPLPPKCNESAMTGKTCHKQNCFHCSRSGHMIFFLLSIPQWAAKHDNEFKMWSVIWICVVCSWPAYKLRINHHQNKRPGIECLTR